MKPVRARYGYALAVQSSEVSCNYVDCEEANSHKLSRLHAPRSEKL